MNNNRAVGIMFRDNKILIMKRFRKDVGEYFAFIGGGTEEDENPEDAVIREVKEEVSLDSQIDRFLFKIFNRGRDEHWYLMKDFEGEPELGGPEKEKNNPDNHYELVWLSKSELLEKENIYPRVVISKISELF